MNKVKKNLLNISIHLFVCVEIILTVTVRVKTVDAIPLLCCKTLYNPNNIMLFDIDQFVFRYDSVGHDIIN